MVFIVGRGWISLAHNVFVDLNGIKGPINLLDSELGYDQNLDT